MHSMHYTEHLTTDTSRDTKEIQHCYFYYIHSIPSHVVVLVFLWMLNRNFNNIISKYVHVQMQTLGIFYFFYIVRTKKCKYLHTIIKLVFKKLFGKEKLQPGMKIIWLQIKLCHKPYWTTF